MARIPDDDIPNFYTLTRGMDSVVESAVTANRPRSPGKVDPSKMEGWSELPDPVKKRSLSMYYEGKALGWSVGSKDVFWGPSRTGPVPAMMRIHRHRSGFLCVDDTGRSTPTTIDARAIYWVDTENRAWICALPKDEMEVTSFFTWASDQSFGKPMGEIRDAERGTSGSLLRLPVSVQMGHVECLREPSLPTTDEVWADDVCHHKVRIPIKIKGLYKMSNSFALFSAGDLTPLLSQRHASSIVWNGSDIYYVDDWGVGWLCAAGTREEILSFLGQAEHFKYLPPDRDPIQSITATHEKLTDETRETLKRMIEKMDDYDHDGECEETLDGEGIATALLDAMKSGVGFGLAMEASQTITTMAIKGLKMSGVPDHVLANPAFRQIVALAAPAMIFGVVSSAPGIPRREGLKTASLTAFKMNMAHTTTDLTKLVKMMAPELLRLAEIGQSAIESGDGDT